MMEQSFRIAELLVKYHNEALNESEELELKDWLSLSEANRKLFSELQDKEEIIRELDKLDPEEKQATWNMLRKQIVPGEEVPKEILTPVRVDIVKIHRVVWWRYAGAAALIGVIVAGVYILAHRGAQEQVGVKDVSAGFKNDVAPGHDGAILTLADGREIILDSAANGTLANQGGTQVKKDGGQVSYSGAGDKEVFYNTITTPKGRQYSLVLSDGSRVWLNAASSIHFPTAFVGGERRVEISGEAYFEIAPLSQKGEHEKMRFIVKIVTPPAGGNGGEVQVLGTHFNIMAYADERAMETTLLEGSIKLSTGNENTILKPGQQAQVADGDAINVVNDADLEQAVAWKNGYISFKHADVKSIMRLLARWYDVDVVYEGNIPRRSITGDITRNTNLSKLLRILEASNIHCSIEGHKLTVKP